MTIAHPIRKLVMILALLAIAAPAAASAQAHLSIRIGLPAVLPPLVVVEPGVQVIQDFGEEVFFVDGYYWARRGDWWYRAHDHRAQWTYVQPRWVPAALVRFPAGHYRHWRGEYRHPQWQQNHRHPQWQQKQAYRQGDWEHGKGQKREWREARAGDHRQGHEGRHH
jgi:hypothetical protein